MTFTWTHFFLDLKKEEKEKSDENEAFPMDDFKFLNFSSQPFDVSGFEPNASFCEAENDTAKVCKTDDASSQEMKQSEPPKRELLIVQNEHSGRRAKNGSINGIQHSRLSVSNDEISKKGSVKTISANESDKNAFANEDVNFTSMDDDMFSESFLIATQAIEDALYNKETGKYNTPSILRDEETRSSSPLARINKPVVLFPNSTKDSTSSGGKISYKNCTKSVASNAVSKKSDSGNRVIGKDQRSSLEKENKKSSSLVKETKQNELFGNKLKSNAFERLNLNSKSSNESEWKSNTPKRTDFRSNAESDRSSFNFQERSKITNETCTSSLRFKPVCKEIAKDERQKEPNVWQKHTKILQQTNNVQKNLNNTKEQPTKGKNIEGNNTAVFRQNIISSKSTITKDLSTASYQAPKRSSNFSQELEADDEDFAALMPNLVEAEEKCSQVSQIRNETQQNLAFLNSKDQTTSTNVRNVKSANETRFNFSKNSLQNVKKSNTNLTKSNSGSCFETNFFSHTQKDWSSSTTKDNNCLSNFKHNDGPSMTNSHNKTNSENSLKVNSKNLFKRPLFSSTFNFDNKPPGRNKEVLLRSQSDFKEAKKETSLNKFNSSKVTSGRSLDKIDQRVPSVQNDSIFKSTFKG